MARARATPRRRRPRALLHASAGGSRVRNRVIIDSTGAAALAGPPISRPPGAGLIGRGWFAIRPARGDPSPPAPRLAAPHLRARGLPPRARLPRYLPPITGGAALFRAGRGVPAGRETWRRTGMRRGRGAAPRSRSVCGGPMREPGGRARAGANRRGRIERARDKDRREDAPGADGRRVRLGESGSGPVHVSAATRAPDHMPRASWREPIRRSGSVGEEAVSRGRGRTFCAEG